MIAARDRAISVLREIVRNPEAGARSTALLVAVGSTADHLALYLEQDSAAGAGSDGDVFAQAVKYASRHMTRS